MWITTTCASAIILCWRQPQWLSDCAKWQSCSHQTRDLNSTCTTEEGRRSGKWLVISAEILLATIHGFLSLAVLQNFDRFLQLLVVLGRSFLFNVGRGGIFVLVRHRAFFGRIRNRNVGTDGSVLNRLTLGRVVLRYRENQRTTVRQLNQLLNRAIAESLIAHNVTAGVFQHSRGNDFGRTGGSLVHQNHQRQGSDGLRRVGVKRLARILLSLQIRYRAVIQEQVGGGDSLLLVSVRTITQIQNQLLGARLLQSFNLAGDLLALALRQRIHMNFANSVLQHLVLCRGNIDQGTGYHDLLRLSAARPDHRQVQV